MTCFYFKYNSDNVMIWILPAVTSKDGIDFTMLFTLRESLRTSGSTSRAYGAFIAKGSK